MGLFDIFSKLKGKPAKSAGAAQRHKTAAEPEAPAFKHTVYIQDAGGCMVSKNILSGRGSLAYCYKEQPKNPHDNGWIFYSSIDDEGYQSNPANMSICDFNAVASIERAVLGIYDMPPGTSLLLKKEGGSVFFLDLNTRERFDVSGV